MWMFLFSVSHPGYFGKVGMRHFHLKRNKYWCPTVNLDKLWSLVTEQTRLNYAKKTEVAPVIDVVRAVSCHVCFPSQTHVCFPSQTQIFRVPSRKLCPTTRALSKTTFRAWGWALRSHDGLSNQGRWHQISNPRFNPSRLAVRLTDSWLGYNMSTIDILYLTDKFHGQIKLFALKGYVI